LGKTILNIADQARVEDPHFFSNIRTVDLNGTVVKEAAHKTEGDPIAWVNHYFCKTKEEFMKKRARGRSDIPGLRDLSAFDAHNRNEVVDLSARKIYQKAVGVL